MALTALSAVAAAQVRLGIKAGFQVSNLEQHKNGNDVPSRFKSGLHAGVTADIPLTERVFVQPGIVYGSRGYKDADAVRITATAHYIEMPVNIVYHYPVQTGHFFIGAGPYIAYALGGKWNMPEHQDGFNSRRATSGKLQFTDDTNTYNFYYITPGDTFTFGRPFDWGANVLMGYTLQRFTLQLSGQLGIANLAPKVDGMVTHDKLKHVGFGLSVGYKLW